MDDRSRDEVRETSSQLDGSSADRGSADRGSANRGSADREVDRTRFDYQLPEVDEPQAQDYVTVPAGSYVCRIEDARTRHTKSGDPLWALKWVVDQGPECGRLAAWDNVVFSARAALRSSKILQAIGLPHRGKVRLGAHDFIGRRAVVRIETGGFEHPASGTFVRRNEVAYDGVRPLEGEEGGGDAPNDETAEDGSDIPF